MFEDHFLVLIVLIFSYDTSIEGVHDRNLLRIHMLGTVVKDINLLDKIKQQIAALPRAPELAQLKNVTHSVKGNVDIYSVIYKARNGNTCEGKYRKEKLSGKDCIINHFFECYKEVTKRRRIHDILDNDKPLFPDEHVTVHHAMKRKRLHHKIIKTFEDDGTTHSLSSPKVQVKHEELHRHKDANKSGDEDNRVSPSEVDDNVEHSRLQDKNTKKHKYEDYYEDKVYHDPSDHFHYDFEDENDNIDEINVGNIVNKLDNFYQGDRKHHRSYGANSSHKRRRLHETWA